MVFYNYFVSYLVEYYPRLTSAQYPQSQRIYLPEPLIHLPFPHPWHLVKLLEHDEAVFGECPGLSFSRCRRVAGGCQVSIIEDIIGWFTVREDLNGCVEELISRMLRVTTTEQISERERMRSITNSAIHW